jgi:hypothetical protein
MHAWWGTLQERNTPLLLLLLLLLLLPLLLLQLQLRLNDIGGVTAARCSFTDSSQSLVSRALAMAGHEQAGAG